MELSELINRFNSATHVTIYLDSYDIILWDGYANNYNDGTMLSDERYAIHCIEAVGDNGIIVYVNDMNEEN